MSKDNEQPSYLKNTDSYVIDKTRLTVEAAYVKKHLGDVLTKCLSEVVIIRPTDPIDYMANWFYKFRETHLRQQQMRDDEQALLQAREDRLREMELLALDSFGSPAPETNLPESSAPNIPTFDYLDQLSFSQPQNSTSQRLSETPIPVQSEHQRQSEPRVKFQEQVDVSEIQPTDQSGGVFYGDDDSSQARDLDEDD